MINKYIKIHSKLEDDRKSNIKRKQMLNTINLNLLYSKKFIL